MKSVLIFITLLLSLTSFGAGLTVSTTYGTSTYQFLEQPTNHNATLTGTTAANGPAAGLARLRRSRMAARLMRQVPRLLRQTVILGEVCMTLRVPPTTLRMAVLRGECFTIFPVPHMRLPTVTLGAFFTILLAQHTRLQMAIHGVRSTMPQAQPRSALPRIAELASAKPRTILS